ncbi:hypothetical protein ACRZ5O_21235 [Pseudomonas protegens]|uniref:hypothetical protein n=1 Tax=Pseudomonas protegens TaxID=380021 RepID=UPI003FD70336
MLEKIGHIKNPLTVIAMFAGIAELSGTVVLPFLEKPIQETYVWFLMGFPVLMVYLFYKTLWRDHTVLYAPSDFQKDESFMQAHFKNLSGGHVGTGLSELSEEVEVVEALPTNTENQVTDEQAKVPDAPIDEVNKQASGDVESHKDLRQYIFHVSKSRILSRLSRLGGGVYHQEVQPRQLPNVIFDGVVESASSFCVVGFTARFYRGLGIYKGALSKIKEAELFWSTLSDEEKEKFYLHVAIMRMRGDEPTNQRLVQRLQLAAAEFPFRIELAEYICEKRSLSTKLLF